MGAVYVCTTCDSVVIRDGAIARSVLGVARGDARRAIVETFVLGRSVVGSFVR